MKPDIKGLEKLAAYLRTVPNKEFDMFDWRVDSPCGTTACIAGHAAMLFPRRFSLTTTGGINDEHKSYWFSHRTSGIGGSKGFAAGFKISPEDAEELTVSERSTTLTTPNKLPKQ